LREELKKKILDLLRYREVSGRILRARSKLYHFISKGSRGRPGLPLLLVCLVLGYLLVWGLYSFISPRHAERTVVDVYPAPVVEPERPAERIEIKPPAVKPEPKATRPPKSYGGARVAIILDDAGNDYINYNAIYSIASPLTLSVLPNLPASRRVALDAASHGMEVMLHLPMEPFDPAHAMSDGTMITTAMSSSEIESFIEKSIASVPGAKGVNNHMGSKATSDQRVTEHVMRCISSRGLFFVDSRTSPKSVAYGAAREVGLRAGRNELFLDVSANAEAVEAKLARLVEIAANKGYAIGIGHATRPVSISVLKRLMPQYEKKGVEFVFASSLVD